MALFNSSSNSLVSVVQNAFIEDAESGMLLFDNSAILVDYNQLLNICLLILN